MSDSGFQWLPLAAGMFILGAGIGCVATISVQALSGGAATAEQAPGGGGFGLPVETETIQLGELPVTYQTLGALRSPNRAVLRPVQRGRVTQINFTDGAMVQAGQLLVELDSANQRAAVHEASVQRTEALRLLKLAQDLRDGDAISQDVVERRKSEVASAEARVAAAQAALDDRIIYAPFTGTITRMSISPGDTVGPDDRIVELIDTTQMRVTTAIPEHYLHALNHDIALNVRTPALPDQDFDAAITYIAPEVDTTNRSILVEASVDNSAGLLRHGQSVDVTAVIQILHNNLSVAEEAILHQGNRISVFVVVDGQAQPRVVTLGPRGAGRVAILAGLQAGDQVVVEGHEMLRPGAPVSIINAEPPAPDAPEAPTAAGDDQ